MFFNHPFTYLHHYTLFHTHSTLNERERKKTNKRKRERKKEKRIQIEWSIWIHVLKRFKIFQAWSSHPLFSFFLSFEWVSEWKTSSKEREDRRNDFMHKILQLIISSRFLHFPICLLNFCFILSLSLSALLFLFLSLFHSSTFSLPLKPRIARKM